MRRLLRRFAKVITKPEAQRFERVGLALLFFVAAVIGRLMVDHVIPGRLPFITFFAAVLLSALYCATLPSVLVLALSAFTGAAWIDSPVGEVVVYRATGFTLFVLVGGSITLFVQLLRDALEQLRAREEQLALINREQKHRMHNLLLMDQMLLCPARRRPRSLSSYMSWLPMPLSTARGRRTQAPCRSRGELNGSSSLSNGKSTTARPLLRRAERA
jgi:hypothetical protein